MSVFFKTFLRLLKFQSDVDNDLVGDVCDDDSDIDGDGIQNNVDNCPYTINGAQLDTVSKKKTQSCNVSIKLNLLYAVNMVQFVYVDWILKFSIVITCSIAAKPQSVFMRNI